jgi:hypothetical protein
VAEVAEEPLPIDLQLHFVLFGLECALGVSFSVAECDRVFRDAVDDQVSTKRYALFESPRLSATGRVDEYEPDTLLLRIEDVRGCGSLLRRAVEGSNIAVFRLRKLHPKE